MVAALALTTALPAMAAGQDTDKDGVPNIAEPLIHTDPLNADTDGDGINDLKDKNPTFAADPIKATGAPAPFKIAEALVENNYDYVHNKGAPDHLELLVQNISQQPVSNFSIYYTITENGTGKKEAYFRKLDGFSVPAGGKARIHFDDSGLPGHFRANPNSIYVTTTTGKVFTVELKADGFKPVTVTIKKDKGGAETAD
jgi:hypothetical protein